MTEFSGLPAHILLIHLVVVGIPVAALLTVLSAVWPAARRRLGIATPVIALLALICVPITSNAGQWLQARVFHGYSNPVIVQHAKLGNHLLLWAIPLFVLAALAWGLPALVGRAKIPAAFGSIAARIVVGVLAVAVAVISVVQVYRIGDAGARAAWSSNFCAQPYVGNTCPSA